jgi:hypothetical protein
VSSYFGMGIFPGTGRSDRSEKSDNESDPDIPKDGSYWPGRSIPFMASNNYRRRYIEVYGRESLGPLDSGPESTLFPESNTLLDGTIDAAGDVAKNVAAPFVPWILAIAGGVVALEFSGVTNWTRLDEWV